MSDRRSGTSSFYGDRRSQDARSHAALPPGAYDPYAPQTSDPRARRDSNSTFFNPHAQDSRAPGGAGYNSTSYFDAGRTEPVKGGYDEEMDLGSHRSARYDDDDDARTAAESGGWDVYADFNNAGPKYSSAFGQQHAYQPISSPTKAEMEEQQRSATGAAPVEMVTVPALGPEWKASELRDMSKTGRREKKAENRERAWTEWRRGQRGFCGGWFTRKVFTFILFGACVAAGIALAFTIPRVPGFSFNSDSPLVNATGDWAGEVPTFFLRYPANFSFPAFADLKVNTNSNYLPLKFTSIKAQIIDETTNMLVATGFLKGKTIPAHQNYPLQLPLNFSYAAVNTSDQTWTNWYDACRNKASTTNGTRPGLDFNLILEMKIFGLVGTKSASTRVIDAECPIELAMNAG